MEQPKHINRLTPDGTELNLEALYRIVPSCFTETLGDDGKLHRVIDFNKLRLLLGDNAVDDAPEVYDFTWVGKRAALKEAAAPITKTLRPCPEESVNWDTTQNLYIEGDNLEVLKLLQNSYMGKVKMIYIDPPYNTGSDFVYHDDFAQSAEEYDEVNRDEEGNRYRKNTDSNGRFHSDWCSMIYARLMVARSLLTEDGVIFISIDENEINNLRNICDEVLGESNWVGTFIWRKKNGGGQAKDYFVIEHEYIVVYRKSDSLVWKDKIVERELSEYNKSDANGVFKVTKLAKWGNTARREDRPSMYFPITAPDGTEVFPIAPDGGDGRWRVGKPRMNEIIEGDLLYWEKKNNKWIAYEKEYYEGQSKVIKERSILYDIANTGDGSNELTELFIRKDTFENPKPSILIKKFIESTSASNSLILDFFSGSATTAHAVMQLNAEDGGKRKFILVQLPEETAEDSEAFKAGYMNICEIGKERIRRAGKKILEEQQKKQAEEGLFACASTPSTGSGTEGSAADSLDIGFRVFKCEDSNYKEVALAPKDYDQSQLEAFVDNIKDDRTDLDLLFDCMLRWGVELSLPLATTKVDGCTIHNVNNGDLVACFDGKVTEAVIEAIAQCSPVRVVFRDSSFTEAAQKMNLFELFKQHCDWTDEEVRNNVRVI